MKETFKSLLVFTFALALSACGGFAEKSYTMAAGGSTNASTTLSWSIVPCNSANGGVPVVTYLNASSDKVGSVVQFYRVDAITQANYTNTTVSVPVSSTNGFGASDPCIIRHALTETYEKVTTTTFTDSTNLTLAVAPQSPVKVGDFIYHLTSTGVSKIPVGVATLSLTGPAIYAGQRGCPVYAEVDGTNATLNAMSISFVP